MSHNKIKKTNAMRILEQNKIEYNVYTYDIGDGKIDGISAALKTGKPPSQVFKTLVTQGHSKTFYVFVIPVDHELDLKKAAKVAKEKKVDMIPVKDITKHTGYIRGGCSPIGMKKHFTTFLDLSAESLDSIVISGGKQGLQLEINTNDFIKVVESVIADLTFN